MDIVVLCSNLKWVRIIFSRHVLVKLSPKRSIKVLEEDRDPSLGAAQNLTSVQVSSKTK